MEDIRIHDKTFTTFIDRQEIQQRVQDIAAQINHDYLNEKVLLLGILNGCFMFAADLFRCLTVECEISFIKLSSYQGMSSGGNVQTAIGLKESLKDRHVIILEDIIDTGKTLYSFLPELHAHQPASVKIASLVIKPDALKYPIHVDYSGFTIENKFILGYGLDYDGLGRNLPDIYILKDPNS